MLIDTVSYEEQERSVSIDDNNRRKNDELEETTAYLTCFSCKINNVEPFGN